jgi:hypothetical protein
VNSILILDQIEPDPEPDIHWNLHLCAKINGIDRIFILQMATSDPDALVQSLSEFHANLLQNIYGR